MNKFIMREWIILNLNLLENRKNESHRDISCNFLLLIDVSC